GRRAADDGAIDWAFERPGIAHVLAPERLRLCCRHRCSSAKRTLDRIHAASHERAVRSAATGVRGAQPPACGHLWVARSGEGGNVDRVAKPRASIIEGALWMVGLSVLLFFVPLLNGFIGGLVGGYRVGG